MNELERISMPEKIREVETKIVLEFMRHAEPVPSEENEEDWKDKERQLTSVGRTQANEKGVRLNSRAKISLAWSSPRVRTKETAYRTMLAKENIDPDVGLEDIEKAISGQIKVGKKLISDKRLDFEAEGVVSDQLWAADEKGEFLSWLLKESDKAIIGHPGNKTLTYSRAAGNIAEIIERYSKVGNNFNKIASKTEKYEEFDNQLERYLGTHQGVVELFIAKVLEKTKGVEERDKFIKALGDGFGFTEGPKIEVLNTGNRQNIYLTFKNAQGKEEKLEIRKELLEEIINEKRELENLINVSK